MRAYAEAVLSIDGDYAYRCMRIAQAFSEDFAAGQGTEKLDRMLRYLAATPEDDGPGDVPTMTVRVPERFRGGCSYGAGLGGCSELRAAPRPDSPAIA